MEIVGKTVLVLGAWGMVGMAICRELLLEEKPALLVLSSLTQEEVQEAEGILRAEFPQSTTRLFAESGNIFLRGEHKDKSRPDLLEDPQCRQDILEDMLEELTPEVLERSFFYQICQRYRPDVVIDCINSATAISYQDIFVSSREVMHQLRNPEAFSSASFGAVMEKHLCTLLIPQLIRHVQIFYESMKRAKTQIYIKVGTSGTGGMGFNIPYTHSEEKPSRVLLSKSAVAGAHTLLLFLMARTPDAPITKEIKPTAAIAWKRIGYGPIVRRGEPLFLYDCPPGEAFPLEGTLRLKEERSWKKLQSEDHQDQVLNSVYIDTGENGIFSRSEFEALTSAGQMEFLTPEEIAHNLIYEIKGGNTGHDIINALDNATMGPTYRAGVMRQSALDKLAELERRHRVDSVAFEMLGPPRISKLLYEAYLIKQVCRTLEGALRVSLDDLSAQMENLILEDQRLRATILSIGIPILLPDGKSLLRGPQMKIPPFQGENELPVTAREIDRWSREGWVDLRLQNVLFWQERIRKIFEEIDVRSLEDVGSRFYRDERYWLQEGEINIGKLVSWILAIEEHGERIKD